jgi:uncharacterized lipoprotein
LVALSLTGCAPQQVRPVAFDVQKTFPSGFDKVWAALMESTMDLGYPVESVEKESGILTTSFVNIGQLPPKEYCNCSGGFFAVVSETRMKMSIFVRAINGNETIVKLNAHIEGWTENVLAKKKDWAMCTSTGVLETDLLSRLEKFLKE